MNRYRLPIFAQQIAQIDGFRAADKDGAFTPRNAAEETRLIAFGAVPVDGAVGTGITGVDDVTAFPYTVVASDLGKVKRLLSTVAAFVIFPAGLGDAFHVDFIQAGTGTVTFIGIGSTVENRQGLTATAGRYARVSAIADVDNEIILSGDLAAGAPYVPPAPPGVFGMGVNISGLEFAGIGYAPPTQSDLAYYKSKGFLFGRLPFLWERIQPTLGGALDADYLALIQAVMDYSASIGFQILLDIHNYGGRDEGKLGAGTTGAQLGDCWVKLSAVFRGHPALYGFDIMNEPSNMPSPSAWPIAAQACISAIRAVDMTTRLFIEGDHYASMGSWQAVNGAIDTLVIDPANNMLWSGHAYLDRDSSGTNYDWSVESTQYGITDQIGPQRISNFTDWLAARGLHGHVGEMGAGNDTYGIADEAGWNDALDKAIAYAQQKLMLFTYWATGPAWGPYPYSAQRRDDGRDATQMAVLTKYTGAAQPTNYFLDPPAVPARAVTGSASQPFTIDYRGIITTPQTYTPRAIRKSDGQPATGTLTPASITLALGFNGKGSFTYTPAADEVVLISTTNDAGLTDAPAIALSSESDFMRTYALDAAGTNLLAFRKISTPYIGPCIRLMRMSDSAEMDFDFAGLQAGAPLDRQAVKNWSAGSALKVVRWYDQGAYKQDLQPVYSDNNGGPTKPSDYPTFVLNDSDGYPAVVLDGTQRADLQSPINGNTAQSIFARSLYQGGARMMSWQFNAYTNFGGGDNFSTSVDSPDTIDLGVINGEWHDYVGVWLANATNGKRTYRDNMLIAEQTTTAPSLVLDYNRSQCNVGYFRFYDGIRWTGKLREVLVFSAGLSDVALAEAHSACNTFYSTPLPALT